MAWAELSDARLAYDLKGEGPPLLLVPGLGTTRGIWGPVVDELARHFTLILIDNRGAGDSIAKRPPTSLADFSADLVELCDHLQLDRTHVLGLSMGGVIAQRFAVDHAPRVDRLVLMSCAHRFGPYLRDMATLIGMAMQTLPCELYVRTMELLGTSPTTFDANPNQVEQKIAQFCTNRAPVDGAMMQLRALMNVQVVADPYTITAPTLVISGDHDAIVPWSYARRMADEIPGSEFMLVHGAGHIPLVEQPQRVMPRMIGFLRGRRCDSWTLIRRMGRVERNVAEAA